MYLLYVIQSKILYPYLVLLTIFVHINRKYYENIKNFIDKIVELIYHSFSIFAEKRKSKFAWSLERKLMVKGFWPAVY